MCCQYVLAHCPTGSVSCGKDRQFALQASDRRASPPEPDLGAKATCRYAFYRPYKSTTRASTAARYSSARTRRNGLHTCNRATVSRFPRHARNAASPWPTSDSISSRHLARTWSTGRLVEFLFRHGVGYHSCGCGGPGYRPSRWKDVRAFLESHRCRSAGEALLARIEWQPRRRAPARAGR